MGAWSVSIARLWGYGSHLGDETSLVASWVELAVIWVIKACLLPASFDLGAGLTDCIAMLLACDPFNGLGVTGRPGGAMSRWMPYEVSTCF